MYLRSRDIRHAAYLERHKKTQGCLSANVGQNSVWSQTSRCDTCRSQSLSQASLLLVNHYVSNLVSIPLLIIGIQYRYTADMHSMPNQIFINSYLHRLRSCESCEE